MTKATIIYMGEFGLPDRNAAAHRVLNNAKAFRALGYNVVFIDVNEKLKFNIPIKDTKRIIQGFYCWSVPYPKSKLQWLNYLSNIKNKRSVMDMYSDVKMVVCYNFPAIALYRMKIDCKKRGISLISDCTEWYHTKGKGFVFGFVKNIDTLLRMRCVQKRLDGIITISSYLKDYYKKHKNIVCIPPLVDATEEKWASESKVNNDMITLVYSGSPGKYKDRMDTIVHSVAEANNTNVRMQIVGISKNEYLAYYPENERIASDKRIEFMGRLDHKKALEILKSADFSIFIRDNNRVSQAGFPTKFVESITCCVPVITNDTSDILRYIKDGYNGFIISGKYDDCLKDIFELPIAELKSIKSNIDTKQFDYTNYIGKFDVFLQCVNGKDRS